MQTVYDCFPNIDQLRVPEHFPDIKDEVFWRVFKKCEPFTMDDYGSFQGARRATDEFLAQLESFPLLNRLHWGARAFTKP